MFRGYTKFFILVSILSSSSATVLLKGKIVEKNSGDILTHIQLRAWYHGKVEDGFSLQDGTFRLELPIPPDSVVISAVGYQRLTLIKPSFGTDWRIQLEIKLYRFPVVEILARSELDRARQLPFSAEIISDEKLRQMSGLSLSQKLNHQGYYVRDYGGDGGVKSLIVRGNRSTDQSCYLDEISLVNPQNGNADLSTIGTMEFQTIEIYQEGLTSILGSGAMNASLQLNSREEFETRISAGIGSFGYYESRVYSGIKINPRIQSFHTLTYSQSKGNFNYDIPRYDLTRNRDNNDYRLFQMYSRNSFILSCRDQFKLSWLWNDNERGMPGLMLNENHLARMLQQNAYLAGVLTHQFSPRLDLQQIVNYTRLHDSYNDPVTPTKSLHHNRIWRSTTRLMGEYGVWKIWSELNWSRESIQSTDMENQSQSRLEFSLAPRYTRSRILSDSDQWSLIWGNRLLMRLQESFYSFYLSNQYQFSTVWGQNLFYINYARNCRVPTLNERFWNPGGNPDLKNEYSYSVSGGHKYHYRIWSMEIALFRKTYKNLIQWLPITYQIWSPKNHQSARNYGLEISGGLDWDSRMSLSAKWTQQDMEVSNSNLQYFTPMYFPENLFLLSCMIKHHDASLNYSIQKFPAVYSSPDNSGKLDGFWLQEIGIHLKYGSWSTQFYLLNLGNAAYCYYVNYPMPGRQFRWVFERNF